MASIAFNRAVALTLVYEGGGIFTQTVGDAGKATKFGVTVATLGAYRHTVCDASDVKALLQPEAEAIYLARYWTPLRCDDYGSDALSAGVFDAGVLTGIGNAAKMLQAVVGAVADGNIGPKTIAAIRAADTLATCIAFSEAWQKYLLAIAQRDATQGVFLIGWLRRAASMQAYFYTFKS